MPAAGASEQPDHFTMKALAALLLCLVALPADAQQVTAFPNANTPLSGTEYLYIVQNGQGRRTTVGALNSSGGIFPSLAVTGNATIGGTLGVTGNSTFSGTLGVSGAGTFGSLVVGSPTGGNEGAGTINATGLYINGTSIGTGPFLPLSGGTMTGTITLGNVAAAPSLFANFGSQTYTSGGGLNQPSVFALYTNPAGTLPTGNSGSFCSYCLTISNDTTNVNGNTQGFSGLVFNYGAGFGWSGGHAAMTINANIAGAITNAGGSTGSFFDGLNVYQAGKAAITTGYVNMIAIAATETVLANLNGSLGNGYGLVESIEGGVFASSTLWGGRFGVTMNSGGTAQGNASQGDAAFTAGGSSGKVGWLHGYGIGKASQPWGLDPNGTVLGPLIQTNGQAVAPISQQGLYGIDLGSVNFSGDAYRSPGFLVDPSGGVYSGNLQISTSGTTTTIDTTGETSTVTTPSTPGATYVANDYLYDTTYDGIYQVLTVGGTGAILTGQWLRLPHCFGGSCPSTITLYGGSGSLAGTGAAVSATWVQGATIGIGTGTATAVNIGNSSSTTTIAGILKGAAGTFTANGSVGTTVTSLGPTGSHTTIQEWLTVTDASGTVRYIPAY